MLDEVVDALERDILGGSARWIADINETFRDYVLDGHKFDIYARGQTRGKGFVLSQFFAWTVLPNYKVSLFGKAVRNPAQFLRGNLLELLRLIGKNMEEHNFKWSWLVLFFEGDPPSRISSLVQEYHENDVGIASVNTYSGDVVVSNNVLGRSLLKHMRLKQVVSKAGLSKGR
jgi:hypothetical protein